MMEYLFKRKGLANIRKLMSNTKFLNVHNEHVIRSDILNELLTLDERVLTNLQLANLCALFQ